MCILCIINLKYSGHQEYVSSVCTSAQDLKINSNLGAQATAIISIHIMYSTTFIEFAFVFCLPSVN